jgi:hypothetical protein
MLSLRTVVIALVVVGVGFLAYQFATGNSLTSRRAPFVPEVVANEIIVQLGAGPAGSDLLSMVTCSDRWSKHCRSNPTSHRESVRIIDEIISKYRATPTKEWEYGSNNSFNTATRMYNADGTAIIFTVGLLGSFLVISY